jgi:hypothetical protein
LVGLSWNSCSVGGAAWRFFFNQWSHFWRILRPGGYFIGSVPLPTSVWAWGNPSHTRDLPSACFIFLNQPAYEHVGKTAMSDFRAMYKADLISNF